jgi:4-hydroxy-tetrahydrodipicolinate synthase
MNILKGTGVALVTPFNEDHSIDIAGLQRLVNHQIENGTNYLVILGTTGENAVLSADESKLVVDTVRETAAGRVPLVLGLGGNNTQALCDRLAHLDTTGLSAILSVSPYYNKPNQEGIYRHYMALADASPLPIILYNVPGRTGANMTAATTLRLAQHPNIIGMKEASGNLSQCMEIAQHKPKDFLLISGDDAFTLPFLSIGMDGVISVICNAFPRQFSSLIQAGLAGDMATARNLHYLLLDSMNLIFEDGSPGGIKEILAHLQICGTTVRPPLYRVNEQVKQALIAACDKVTAHSK